MENIDDTVINVSSRPKSKSTTPLQFNILLTHEAK